MRAAGQAGSIVTLMCDPRERYVATYADDGWLASQGLDLAPYLAVLDRAWTTGSGPAERAGQGETTLSSARPSA